MLSTNIKSLQVSLFLNFFLIFISISLYTHTHTNYFFSYQFLAIYCSLFDFYITKLSFLTDQFLPKSSICIYINECIYKTLKSLIIHIEYMKKLPFSMSI